MAFRDRLRRFTLIETLVAVAVVLLLVAALLPALKYSWSGERTVSIRARLNDVSTGKPISGAKVTLWVGTSFCNQRTSPGWQLPEDVHAIESDDVSHGVTDSRGEVQLRQKFFAGGSHLSDSHEGWVHLEHGCVCVTADGYGVIAIPVRHEPMRCDEVKKRETIDVLIGLLPRK